MNCIGPTARSWTASPSYAPPSVSLISAKPWPLRAGPRMRGLAVPFASTRPPRRAWPDSTLPIAARSCQGSRQEGSVVATVRSACLYAARTEAGMPASALPAAGRPAGRTGPVGCDQGRKVRVVGRVAGGGAVGLAARGVLARRLRVAAARGSVGQGRRGRLRGRECRNGGRRYRGGRGSLAQTSAHVRCHTFRSLPLEGCSRSPAQRLQRPYGTFCRPGTEG